jgi:hypothetical protein
VNQLLVVTPSSITFANLATSTMEPYSCELNQMLRYEGAPRIKHVVVEQKSHTESRIFALTTDQQLVYFHVTTKQKNESFECRLTSTVTASWLRDVD